LKRSSRLIILVGILLAVLAFAGIIYLNANGTGSNTTTTPTTTKVVIASTVIPLGSAITADQVTTKDMDIVSAPAGAYTNPNDVVGKVVRVQVNANDVITSADFSAGYAAQGDQVVAALKAGYRAIAIQVDQATGVGTLIQPGDRVDIVIGLKIQEYVPGANPSALPQPFPPDPQLSVKNIIENVEVVGTLLPPPTTTTTGQQAPSSAAPANGGTALSDQKEIVLVAVTAQQAEVIKYAQTLAEPIQGGQAGLNITLILRSPQDKNAPIDKTTGVVLKTLIDQYGVLPPSAVLASAPPR